MVCAKIEIAALKPEKCVVGDIIRKFSIVSFMIFYLSGCDMYPTDFAVSEIEGCYEMSTEDFTDTFCINEDGSYTQSHTIDGKPELFHAGNWNQIQYHKKFMYNTLLPDTNISQLFIYVK